ncbi:VOC family protein [Devosia nitrariae]|uniref:VOC domain-containing protein n=1 Tax=Devosia nitrariae TaxID=2071872 RepID=A0ABQ5W7X0_9HYPH|nr:VOC family protein [Devosia nitrariae]GLQ56162.1 hypothetical protein GCM10010862_34210 [Devosia nitrariae]
MRIEHLAFNVTAPFEMADWYVAHLGMQIVKRGETGCFLSDKSGMLLELYEDAAAPALDGFSFPPATFHLAFAVDEVENLLRALVKGGGRQEGTLRTLPSGDRLAFVRDPWGFPLQLVSRAGATP